MSDTLLLADDSVTMQRVVELTFAQQGLNVVSVSDGQQALDYISAHRPALALISVTLQKVSGFDVARFVRDHPHIGRVPVLLLAGAFDTIDDAQVRESGAAGVLVKPFEPALVIKRVKELLGMSTAETTRPVAVPPSRSSSGRLVTSNEGPVPSSELRNSAPGTSPEPVAEAAPVPTPAPQIDDEVAGAESGSDYLEQLDAAFDSLDAQLAGRPAPAGRATNAAPPPRVPAAIDPTDMPSAPPASPDASAADRLEPSPAMASAPTPGVVTNPVFEIDDKWFGEKPPAPDLGDLNQFVITRAGDHVSSPATGDDRSWAPRGAYDERPVDVSEATSSVPRTETPAMFAETSPATVAMPPEAIATPPATIDTPPATLATPPGSPAADGIAMRWTEAQGEPLPPSSPLELSESAANALATRVSEGLADRIVNGLAARVPDGIADRITQPLATRLTEDLTHGLPATLSDRLTGGVADRLNAQLPGPIAAGISERIGTSVSERVTAGVAEHVTRNIAERVTAGVADRVAGDLAERVSADVATRMAAPMAERISAALADQLATAIADRLASGLVERLTASLTAPLTGALTERVTAGLTEPVTRGVADRVTEGVADRITEGLADRLTEGLAERLTTRLADSVASGVADRVTTGLAERVTQGVAERSAPVVADRLTANLSDRVSNGLAEHVAGTVAERLMQNTFGDSLRQTVNEVSERVVRAEIERIRAAAESLRGQ